MKKIQMASKTQIPTSKKLSTFIDSESPDKIIQEEENDLISISKKRTIPSEILTKATILELIEMKFF